MNSPQPTPNHGLGAPAPARHARWPYARRRPGAFRQPRRRAKRMLPTGRPQRQQAPAGNAIITGVPAGWPARTSLKLRSSKPHSASKGNAYIAGARHSAPRRTQAASKSPGSARRTSSCRPANHTAARLRTTSEARHGDWAAVVANRPPRQARSCDPDAIGHRWPEHLHQRHPPLSATSRPQHRPSTASARCAPAKPRVQAPRPPPQPPGTMPGPTPRERGNPRTRPAPRAPPGNTSPRSAAPAARDCAHPCASRAEGPEQQHRASSPATTATRLKSVAAGVRARPAAWAVPRPGPAQRVVAAGQLHGKDGRESSPIGWAGAAERHQIQPLSQKRGRMVLSIGAGARPLRRGGSRAPAQPPG